jgi:hypothetical protein
MCSRLCWLGDNAQWHHLRSPHRPPPRRRRRRRRRPRRRRRRHLQRKSSRKGTADTVPLCELSFFGAHLFQDAVCTYRSQKIDAAEQRRTWPMPHDNKRSRFPQGWEPFTAKRRDKSRRGRNWAEAVRIVDIVQQPIDKGSNTCCRMHVAV